ncbi:MAG: helix-turn-helix domain-containing protein [Oscillospiraceae bacterium]|nr:helix-turn-helix domain-containing protein [Oscillospiraceae bacterium]
MDELNPCATRLRELRREKGMTQLELATKFSRAESTIRMWELGKNEPDNETILELSKFFHVPTDFLLGRAPFEHWELINADRKGFLHSAVEDWDFFELIWASEKNSPTQGIDRNNPDTSPISQFVEFLKLEIESAHLLPDGTWSIKLKSPDRNGRTAKPVQDDLQAALFGGDGEITDDMWEDVKRYAAFIKQRKKEMSDKDGQP